MPRSEILSVKEDMRNSFSIDAAAKLFQGSVDLAIEYHHSLVKVDRVLEQPNILQGSRWPKVRGGAFESAVEDKAGLTPGELRKIERTLFSNVRILDLLFPGQESWANTIDRIVDERLGLDQPKTNQEPTT